MPSFRRVASAEPFRTRRPETLNRLPKPQAKGPGLLLDVNHSATDLVSDSVVCACWALRALPGLERFREVVGLRMLTVLSHLPVSLSWSLLCIAAH